MCSRSSTSPTHIGTMTLRQIAGGADDGHEVTMGLGAAAKLRMLGGRADQSLFHRVPSGRASRRPAESIC